MSKGSRIIAIRIPDEMFAEIVNAYESANEHKYCMPYGVTTWIRKACQEKLDHLRRSKNRKTAARRLVQTIAEQEKWADMQCAARQEIHADPLSLHERYIDSL